MIQNSFSQQATPLDKAFFLYFRFRSWLQALQQTAILSLLAVISDSERPRNNLSSAIRSSLLIRVYSFPYRREEENWKTLSFTRRYVERISTLKTDGGLQSTNKRNIFNARQCDS